MGGMVSSEIQKREVGMQLDVGWGSMALEGDSEGAEARERRVRMNVRYLGSRPGVNLDAMEVDDGPLLSTPALRSEVTASTSILRDGSRSNEKGGYIATCPQQTRNEMFVDRLEGMFGSGYMDRGNVGKPKVKVGDFHVIFWPFNPFFVVRREMESPRRLRLKFGICCLCRQESYTF
jgi:hypothetical protein